MSTRTDDRLVLEAQPDRVTAGGIVLLTAKVQEITGSYTVTWDVEGPVHLSQNDIRVALLGAASVTGGPVQLDGTQATIRATLDTGPLAVGAWSVTITLTPPDDVEKYPESEGWETHTDTTGPIQVLARPFASGDDVSVTMRRTAVASTPDQALWAAIRNSARAVSYDRYRRFMDMVMCGELPDRFSRVGPDRVRGALDTVSRRTSVPFPNVERYRLLKVATEVFLMTHCGIDDDFSGVDLNEESRRQNRTVHPGDLEEQWRDYLTRIPAGDEDLEVLPYLALIRFKLADVPIVGFGEDESARVCQGILAEKLVHPTFLELIWSYWHEEGFLAQTMNAIGWRFQNRATAARDPLAHLEIDPLRPISNILWGREQDRQHRLTTARRAYEYDHEYGLTLAAMSGPPVRGADSRPRFVEAFHNLLRLCLEFYREDDVTTVIADGFGVLNALKETHMLLSQGAHNQYGDLPWTARHEMLMDQWILDRPEIRTFLPSRPMVATPEGWIDAVQAMTKLQGWTDTPVLHFRDLGVFGEQLLLGIRFGNWTAVVDPDQAANWARYWRAELQQYVHAYRAVTGVDLARRTDAAAPAYHLRQRQLSHRR
jgi:hypothetical protein